MNLVNIIERKGKVERMQDTITESISEMFSKHIKPFEGMPNNADTVRIIQERLQHVVRDMPFPIEAISVDVPGLFGEAETIRSEVALR